MTMEACHEQGLGWNFVFFIIGDAVPAWSGVFYIMRDRATQKCSIVDKPPIADTSTITLADDTIYKSRPEAEAGMKNIRACQQKYSRLRQLRSKRT